MLPVNAVAVAATVTQFHSVSQSEEFSVFSVTDSTQRSISAIKRSKED